MLFVSAQRRRRKSSARARTGRTSAPRRFLAFLLRKRFLSTEKNRKEREREREREMCVQCVRLLRICVKSEFWLKNLARGAKIALFWFQNQTDRGRIFGSKIIRQTEGAFLVQNHQTERRIFGLFFFFIFFFLFERIFGLFSGGVRHL